MERLQKIIANSGYCSRRKAEELIVSGVIKVNGKTIYELGTKVNLNDAIEIEGKPLKQEAKVYYLLNKPRGVITSVTDDKGRQTVVDLIDTTSRVYPVGRLDYDTTGALLLTNDGEFANYIMHPKHRIDKLYIAKVKGMAHKKELVKLLKGIFIDEQKVSAAEVKLKKYDKKTNTSIVEIVIHDGKNHQVKKMLKAIGYDVIKLKREKIAFLDVKHLKSGEYRELTIKEIKKIYGNSKK